MKYAILVYETPAELASREDPAASGAYWAAYTAYCGSLVEAGIALGGAGLHPPAVATTVRLREGQRHVRDGPLADTKEQLGGLFMIGRNAADAAASARPMTEASVGQERAASLTEDPAVRAFLLANG